ncbi:NUDIX hydrolase [Acidiferrimicrobium sp. IK]|uniref:NUDIX hydrolase n=1 Tax=Acidiferrimicrobium sp. IK TaxID=2871700 RepID=UPI0021CB87F5|nr:NUDIX hydrolase [Acidiferrimicrobium sp. IK]MCU4184740.1 NUDIX hydrolase [Acidiferrimicrobium sp. IK]
MPPFRKLAEEQLLATQLFRVAEGRFESPTGEPFTRTIIHHPGAVAVVPLVNDRTALLVRQYRAAVDRELLEIPAGKRDVAGEAVEVTAARELEEEVGRRAGQMDLVARFYNSVGISDEYTHVFVARDLTEVPTDLQGIEENHMTTEEVALADVAELIAAGELADAKTIVGLTLAMLGARPIP